jgi:hypothetical protein
LDSQNRTARKRQAGKDNQDRTARKAVISGKKKGREGQ